MNGLLDKDYIINDFPIMHKPPRLGEMILGKSVFNSLFIILVKILYEKVHKEIGLNVEKEEVLVSLGTRARK